ncbi:uncharacterized protein SAPINGB_P002422 [Magnusiomyces paraingens]|uniref:Peptidase M16 N-terminal domain-containing protein n=1 Tax=Magnusiomyces paraingens TaxID=2606893 RepID=A0A5E8BDT7_9ASCO|nr:uncharacterized protein SAPINGB_P002422 [Saprochaete ingens]VVT49745.1 unnamed protein product [Saprochaete ingens]
MAETSSAATTAKSTSDHTASIVSSAPLTNKPLLDDRDYRYITLENGLLALLIHDPETDKAAAALDVNVGSFSDPEDLPGLAHFCEHLLFMGTEKFPKENEYASYLSSHSGYSNAYTSSESTNYHFEVGYEHFNGALDRFSQFFISPLFSPSCKDREIRAVDSENKNNLQNDNWRLHQISRFFSNHAHPYHKYSTGNLETLETIPLSKNIDVRDRLLEFYDNHYSANLMKLVLIGRESLDTLQQWTVDFFSPIVNKNRKEIVYSEPFLDDENLGILIQAKPVKEKKVLSLRFPIPSDSVFNEAKPLSYASFCIGHEGPGSILNLLKEKGWASSLSSGAGLVSEGQAFSEIDIALTERGLSNYKEIIAICFQYLKLLQSSPISERLFQEQKIMSEVNFKYTAKKNSLSTVTKLASQMQRPYPLERLLDYSVFTKFDPNLTRKYIDYFNVHNFRATLVAQTLEGLDKQEKWYGTHYRSDKFDPDFIKYLEGLDLNPDLALPTPNEFIPENFDVDKKENVEILKHPILLRNQKQVKVWYKKDDTFWTPKASVNLYFKAPITYSSPSNYVKSSLYFRIVDDHLTLFAYHANLAGLAYDVSVARDGFKIHVRGYNNKIGLLLERILLELKDFKVDRIKFETCKERLVRELKNQWYAVSYNQFIAHFGYLLNENTWTLEERLHALENVTYEEVVEFGPQVLKRFDLEVVAIGNLHKNEALEIANQTMEILVSEPIPDSQSVCQRSYYLPPSSEFEFSYLSKDEHNVNSGVEFFIQVAKLTDPYTRVVLELLASMAVEPAFNQLRTREQLGYIVFCGMRLTRTSCGLRIIVQSERTTSLLKQRVDRFLIGLGEIIENYTNEEFNTYVTSLIAKKQEKYKNLYEESSSYNAQIVSGYYHFSVQENDIEILKKISKREVLELYYKYISPQSKDRSLLILSLNAHNPPTFGLSQVTASVFTMLAIKYNVNLDPAEAAELLAKAEGKSSEEVLQMAADALEEKGHGDIAQDFIKEAAEEILLQTSLEAQERPQSQTIESVSWFKSRLQLTEAPVPWEDLAIFMEPEAKL